MKYLNPLFLLAFSLVSVSDGETLRHPESLQQQLLSADTDSLAQHVHLRGDARRGALIFFRSAAACVRCHASGEESSPLGPNLAKLPRDTSTPYILDALLRPSKQIAKGFETYTLLTDEGTVHRGLLVRETDSAWRLRDAANLSQETEIAKDRIEAVEQSDQSMMPEGLMASLQDQGQFLDLVAYISAVARGGPAAAEQLRPSEEQLKVKDDSLNLDHAGIINGLNARDEEAGRVIYHGYCVECHGADGNTPSLPTARAFGTQTLRFGADPFRMFLTLTRGNGLMAPMSHLTPKERYQVVHYIREAFMRGSNPDYQPPDAEYLKSLPEGTESGDQIEVVERDFGPALASQLRRDFPSVLTIGLGAHAIAYDTHTMNQADLWTGGDVDLTQTQHLRDRGEGTVRPAGESITALATWQWGHENQLDYSKESLLPRGPLPKQWLNYHGHYLHGDRVVLHYDIDGRTIWESPSSSADASPVIQHSLRIGPGRSLKLAVAAAAGASEFGVRSADAPDQPSGPADGAIAFARIPQDSERPSFVAATVHGDTDGLHWTIDAERRIVLSIPADTEPRVIQIRRGVAADLQHARSDTQPLDPQTLTRNAPLLWPQTLETTGYRGLERGAYALDTITIPERTPWNTWFRTSAIDFFGDGRMAVATYGGDVWIVSGVDQDLLKLRWKRYAGGLYEPMGLKVVDDVVYVTCKDRLTRLHDLNSDGEADYYESFSADEDVSVNFHAFNFDLQRDAAGNFYYAKAGHGADYTLPGAIIQISPDGHKRSVYCTGFRSPNGMGMLPDGRLTVSDNQGQWTPASKINLLRRGGFYGWVPTYGSPGKWAPDGGRLDLSKMVPPTTFDPPLVWMPQEFDNSSGGQLWAGDPRWGPLAGHLLHTSFGRGWMSYLMMQEVDGQHQAAIVKLPFDWQTGIMRASVNPRDGQVYATGLQGWNGGGRIGLQDKGIQRLRYTGVPEWMITDATVEHDGLRLRFTLPVDAASAADPTAYNVHHWNYHWRASYGSSMYSPSTDQEGQERLEVASVEVDQDRQGVKLQIPGLRLVDQLHLTLELKDPAGHALVEELYWTIHALPQPPR